MLRLHFSNTAMDRMQCAPRRSVRLHTWACLARLACAVAGRPLAADDAPRPNIVLIVADDLGYGELGCQGNDEIPTPHIDSIADDGVRFTAGYVTAPFCSASRAGLLTGRYQTRFGYEFNPIGAANEDPAVGLPPETVTLAERLHAVGYATGLCGKWHLGGTAAYHPQRSGFDEFFGFRHEGHYYLPPNSDGAVTWLRRRALPNGGTGRWTSGDGRLILSTHLGSDEPAYDADNPILRESQPVAESEYLTDSIGREAVGFIKRHHERPYFLYVAFNAVHSPMQALDADLRRFAHIEDIQRRIFAAMLSRLDENVGRILTAIQESGRQENSLVWFLSDNGGPTRELTSSNAPLRGGKGELYEGGVRIPFLVRWPAVFPGGRVEDRAVLSLDIYATSSAAAGIDLSGKSLDGVDLRPYLTGGSTSRPHDVMYWRVGRQAALRSGNWKIVRGRRPNSAWQLFNLERDPGESTDLAKREPDVLRRLNDEFSRLDAEMPSNPARGATGPARPQR